MSDTLEMTIEELLARCVEMDTDAQLMNGFDDCIIGMGECAGKDLIIYDYEKVITQLTGGGMSDEDAREFYEFNMAAGMDNAPVFQHIKVRAHGTG
jgi:hypothetical protein